MKELQQKLETSIGKRDEMPRRHTAPPKGPDAFWKQIFGTTPLCCHFLLPTK